MLEGDWCYIPLTTALHGVFGVTQSNNVVVRYAKPNYDLIESLSFDGTADTGDPVIDWQYWSWDWFSYHHIGFCWGGSSTSAFTGFADEFAENPENGKYPGGNDLAKVCASVDESSGSFRPGWLDNVRVRKYVYPEPANGAWGQLQADGAWLDNNWDYRKPCVVGAASGAGTGYQVRVNVHYLNGTDSGADVFLGGKCKGGFGDVRFTAVDGTSLLSCWMETPVCDNATFWVKVSANLTASPTIIYIYYGNFAADSISSGTATFDFFDDFSTDTGWTMNNTSIECGTLNLYDYDGSICCAQKNRPSSGYDDYRFRFREATAASNSCWLAYPRGTGSYPYYNPRLTVGDYSYDPTLADFTAQGGNSMGFYVPIDEMGHVIQVLKSGSSYTLTWDESRSSSNTDSTQETGTKIAFCTVSNLNAPLQIDWVFLAKYISSEPAFGGWGTEEGTGSAAPSPVAVLFYGSQDYAEWNATLVGGHDERVLSSQVSDYVINDLFATDGRYGYCANYWGSCTQPDFVHSSARYCEAKYDFTVIFYKGHSMEELHNGTTHYEVYDSEGQTIYGFNLSKHDYIKDYYLYGNVTAGEADAGRSFGTHDFVFLWTCGHGADNRTGTNSTADPWGMLSCWMDTDANSTMSRDGYASNETDNSSQCFIGFDYLSHWFIAATGYNNADYGMFVYEFFQFALDGYPIREALNQASIFCHNSSLGGWDLYDPPGYDIYDPRANNGTGAWVKSRIRIWGDGDTVIPHN